MVRLVVRFGVRSWRLQLARWYTTVEANAVTLSSSRLHHQEGERRGEVLKYLQLRNPW